jgi:signal transduction histidine kinase
MRLSLRFFLSHALVAVVTLGVCLLLLSGAARFVLAGEAARLQRQKTEALAQAAREAAVSQDELAVLSVMREALRDPGVAFAAWEPPARPRIVQPDSLAELVPHDAPEARLPSPRPLGSLGQVVTWTLAYPLPRGGHGLVRLGFDQVRAQAAIQERLRAWLPPAITACLAALILGALASFWVGRQMAEPLRRIAEGTRAVRAGRLDQPVMLDRRDEIGDLARDFNAMTVQLKELDAMKRDFVSGVTHDLGTPLQAIRSASNALIAGRAGALNNGQSEYLLMISNHLEGLTAFIQNLLSMARIEAGKVEPYYETFDAAKMLGEWVKLYRAQAEEKGLELAFECRLRDASLHADLLQFRQMFANLLSNAFKFTREGGILVELLGNSQWLILKVADTGIGIDPRYHQLVFDRFFRVRQPKGAPARQGTGLGLAIAKGLAEAHGGGLSVQSRLGHGSTFILELPRRH